MTEIGDIVLESFLREIPNIIQTPYIILLITLMVAHTIIEMKLDRTSYSEIYEEKTQDEYEYDFSGELEEDGDSMEEEVEENPKE